MFDQGEALKDVGVAGYLVRLSGSVVAVINSDVLILAVRPVMGKTSLASNIAFNVATANLRVPSPHPVAFFSLEMSAEELATRILAEGISIPSEKQRLGQLVDDDFGLLVQASQDLERAVIYIDDTPAIPISTLCTLGPDA
ncbi:MAG: DnaB-like helicase C-terminal domain-containing protein [Thalassobaculum sp.]